MELLNVHAGPGLLCAASAMVAVDAHVLGVVASAGVGAVYHLPLLAFGTVKILVLAGFLIDQTLALLASLVRQLRNLAG